MVEHLKSSVSKVKYS